MTASSMPQDSRQLFSAAWRRQCCWRVSQQLSGFRQYRLGRHYRTDPVVDRSTALRVMRLAAIEERDQRALIE